MGWRAGRVPVRRSQTTQVWNRGPDGAGPFEPGTPWLLRNFDRIRWHPVEAEELLEQRAELAAGRLRGRDRAGELRDREQRGVPAREAAGIAAFRATQAEAFAGERAAWAGGRRVRRHR